MNALISQWIGDNSCEGHAKSMAIRTESEWRKAWLSAYSRTSPMPNLPAIDFTQDMVIAVFLGRKGSSGYRVRVAGVEPTESGLLVHVVHRSPPRGEMSALVMTSPFCFTVVPVSPAEPEFEYARDSD